MWWFFSIFVSLHDLILEHLKLDVETLVANTRIKPPTMALHVEYTQHISELYWTAIEADLYQDAFFLHRLVSEMWWQKGWTSMTDSFPLRFRLSSRLYLRLSNVSATKNMRFSAPNWYGPDLMSLMWVRSGLRYCCLGIYVPRLRPLPQ